MGPESSLGNLAKIFSFVFICFKYLNQNCIEVSIWEETDGVGRKV